jgi:phage FluMu protein Com
MTTVDDYIGIVDGTTHYVTFGGKEVKGKSLTIDGDADDYTLDATFKWDDNAVHSRTLSGSQSAAYTITYSLPSGTGGDDDVVLTKHGTATITLIPTYVSESAEGDKNYYDNTSSSSSNDVILDSLLGNLVASGTVSVVGTTDTTSSNVTLSDTSNLIEIGTDDGIGEYDTYVPVTRTLLSPADDGTYITGTYIEVGTCSKRGDNLPHECAYTYPSGNIDFWRCIYCQMYLPIRRSTTVTYVHTHNYIKYSEIPATCSSKGLLVKMCVCGSQISEVLEENAGNHSGLSHKVDPAATCENDGYEYDECTGCGTRINGNFLTKLGHQWSTTAISTGTGHTPSYIIQTCSRCNKTQTISSGVTVVNATSSTVSSSLSSATTTTSATTAPSSTTSPDSTDSTDSSDSTVITTTTTILDSTAHSYVYKYTEQNCTDGEYEIWQCSVCGDIVKKITKAAAHHYEYKYTERDCMTGTYEIWQCSTCSEIEKRMTASSTGHIWVEQSGGRESTCTINGYTNYRCTQCGSTKVEMKELNDNHVRTATVYEPELSCTEWGTEYQQCLACGKKTTTGVPKAPLGHDYKVLLDTDPTCFEEGLNVQQCTRCYEVVTTTTPALDHDYEESENSTVIDSQCTVDGLKELICKYCKTTKYEAISMTGHTPGDAATCTEDQTCTVCGAVLAKATGHTYVDEVTAPTCTTMGYTTHKCKDCDYSYIDSYTDAVAHDYKGTKTAATCTSMGYTTYTCKNCTDTYTSDYTDVISHNYKGAETKPTCTTMGYTTYTCEDCKNQYVSDYTDVIKHNYKATVTNPTCTAMGYTTYVCQDCNDTYVGDYTDPSSHAYILTKTKPTCTTMGYITYTCKVCSDEYVGDYSDPLGHDYRKSTTVDPTCTTMGYTVYKCKVCTFGAFFMRYIKGTNY